MKADINPPFWQGKRVFVTGHTGFKGSWLCLWLEQLGAIVQGYALDSPTDVSLFEQANVATGMQSQISDIRDSEALASSMIRFQPEIVLHMAAQPLVRLSYAEPVETYSTNVMGTVHLLEAVRKSKSVRAVVNVTSDKCYDNKEWVWGYQEDEPMGGYDPYSNSKGCAELVASAYRNSYFNNARYDEHGVALASCRAGNVIGGGDWADDRLIPDILRAFETNSPVVVRNPHAIRPWQHVLEPLSGYLLIAENLFHHGPAYAEGWNFGPNDSDARPVDYIADKLVTLWGEQARWQLDGAVHPHEAGYLKLDCSKARQRLNWEPRWNLDETLERIVKWHKAWLNHDDMRQYTINEINDYMKA